MFGFPKKQDRRFCQKCKKDRKHEDGSCVVCQANQERVLEVQRLSDTSFAHLNPEE